MFVILSCSTSKEDISPDMNFSGITKSGGDESTIVIDGTEMIMGEEIQDPYSLATIREAYDSVVKTSNVTAGSRPLAATHLYVRFFPKDSIDLELLEAESELDLYSYPLDREVVRYGSVTSDELNSRYAAVPIGHEILNEVSHTVLDSLCFPDEIPVEEVANLNLTPQLVQKIEDEAILIADLGTGGATPMGASTEFYPRGCVKVYDHKLDDCVPVEGVRVRMRRGTRTYHVYTDENGCFQSTKKFKEYANVSLLWESGKWDIRDGALKQASTSMGKISYRTGYSQIAIGGVSKDWAFATIQRAAQRFWFKDICGISRPNYCRKIKIRYTHEDGTSFNNQGDGWGIFTDIRIFREEKSEYLLHTAFHEIAHCTQEGIQESKKMRSINITIRESWANFVAYILTSKEYLDLGMSIDKYKEIGFVATNSIIGEEIIDNSMVYLIPNFFNKQDWELEYGSKTYTPLFIDLYDNSNQYNYYNKDDMYPNDKIRSIPPETLQSIAFSARNKSELINKLRNLENKDRYKLTDENINLYFDYYSYNF